MRRGFLPFPRLASTLEGRSWFLVLVFLAGSLCAPAAEPGAAPGQAKEASTPPAVTNQGSTPAPGGAVIPQPPAATPQPPAPTPQATAPKMLPGFPPAQPKVQVQQPAPAVEALEPSKKTSEPQAIAIVDNYLKVIGGKDVLAKIKDKTTKYTNVKFEATGEVKVEINLLMKDAICIREEWDVKGFKIKDMPLAFVQIYNGNQEEGWVHMMDTVSPLEGKTLQLFVRDKYMDDFFCHWESDGYILSLAGQGLVAKEFTGTEEQACDILLVSDFWGRAVMSCYFSKVTGLLLKKEWQDVGTTAKGGMSKKEKFYKDYRDIPFMDGSGLSVKFALRNENYVDGDMDTEQIYTEVRINSGLSDKLFERPPGKAFDRTALESQKAAKEGEKKADSTAPGEDAKAAHGREKPPIIQLTPGAGTPAPVTPAPEKPKETAPPAGSPAPGSTPPTPAK